MYRFNVSLLEFKNSIHDGVETEESMWYMFQEAGLDISSCK